MPGSFFGRSLLILLLPLLLLQVVSAFVFYNRHWEDVGRRLALGLGGEISILVEAIESYPDGADRDWIMAQAHPQRAPAITINGKMNHASSG